MSDRVQLPRLLRAVTGNWANSRSYRLLERDCSKGSEIEHGQGRGLHAHADTLAIFPRTTRTPHKRGTR